MVVQIVKGLLPGREFDWSNTPFDFIRYMVRIEVMVVILKLVEKKRPTQVG